MSGPDSQPTPEKVRLSVETITGKELLKQIYTNGEPDPRFLPINADAGGVFYFSPLDPFSEIRDEGIHYSVLSKDNRIIGIAQIQESPFDENVLWFKSISIDKDLKGQGYSENLMREIFRFAKSKGAKLWISRPTQEGRERTRYKLKGIAEEFGVQIFGSNGEPFTE
jgi:GNAT superfamily N-acetyltransferase